MTSNDMQTVDVVYDGEPYTIGADGPSQYVTPMELTELAPEGARRDGGQLCPIELSIRPDRRTVWLGLGEPAEAGTELMAERDGELYTGVLAELRDPDECLRWLVGAEGQTLLDRVCAGYEESEAGGSLDDDAAAAWQTVLDHLSDDQYSLIMTQDGAAGTHSAWYWYEDEPPGQVPTADTTDEELAEMVEAARLIAEERCVILYDLEDYYQYLREQAQDRPPKA